MPSKLPLLAALLLGLMVPACGQEGDPPVLEKRWVYLDYNLLEDGAVAEIREVVRRAAAAGYNGVLFTDYKTTFWWTMEQKVEWWRNARAVREAVREEEMTFALREFPFGHSGPVLWHDPNLAAGVPLRDVPLRVEGNRLTPVETAAIEGGDFENWSGDRAEVTGLRIQDGPGRLSFADREISRIGEASLRITNVEQGRAGNGRFCVRVKVLPFQQYRVRVSVRAQDLVGGSLQMLGYGLQDERSLIHQSFQIPDGEGDFRLVRQADGLTFDWADQVLTFNSLENTEIDLYGGVWEGGTGTSWWDDLRLETVPTLNLLRRDSLPVTVRDETGTEYTEGRDFGPVIDRQLGQNGWAGNYDIAHEAPGIPLPPGSRLKQGQTVYLSAWHAQMFDHGQVSCSLLDQEVFRILEESLVKNLETFQPDVLFMSHDEIRAAGWEPNAAAFENTGAMLTENVRRCQELLKRHAPDTPVMIWSDMFDPAHNAEANHYYVANTLEGAWEGLDPSVEIMDWSPSRKGAKFFADRGHSQMIAAFYDQDVQEDHETWMRAVRGIPGIRGVMYTTWEQDYSQLEEFARQWWGSAEQATAP